MESEDESEPSLDLLESDDVDVEDDSLNQKDTEVGGTTSISNF